MKKILLLLILLSILQPASFAQKQAPPAGGKPKDFALPKRASIKLENGLQASLVPYGKVPKATVSIYVYTGNMHEKANEVLLSDLLADLMREGTKGRSAEQLSDEVAQLGGSLNISSTPNSFIISGSALSEYTPQLIKIFADVLINPLLPGSQLDRLKTNLKREVAVGKTQPRNQAYEKFLEVTYPNQPYGYGFGKEEDIDKFTIEKVKNFYDTQFGAQRTHIYVSGMFDQAPVEKTIKDAFSGWIKGPAKNIIVAKPNTQKGFQVIERPGASQSTIYLGLPVIDPSNPDYIPLLVSNSLLGGSFGSRITSNIRENKGYTYSPSAAITDYYKSGTWIEQADVTTEHTGASLKEIFSEVSKLQSEAPGSEELEGIKNYMGGIFVLQNSTPGGIIGKLAFVDLHGLSDSYLTNYVKNVYAVTPEKVSQTTKKYIRAKDMTLIVVGDKSKIDSQLEPYKPKQEIKNKF